MSQKSKEQWSQKEVYSNLVVSVEQAIIDENGRGSKKVRKEHIFNILSESMSLLVTKDPQLSGSLAQCTIQKVERTLKKMKYSSKTTLIDHPTLQFIHQCFLIH